MSNYNEYKVKVYPDGTKDWYLNGDRHREDGPAHEGASGHKEWFLNDKLHREDGPAIEWTDGTKFWFLNGEIHREDGPAVEHADGYKAWFLNDKELTESEFNQKTKVTEMTMEEICKALGKTVKVIK